MNTVGQRLEFLFQELKKNSVVKNKKEFSQKIGIDDSNYSKYVKGIIDFKVNGDIYQKLLDLSINIGWLLSGTGEAFIKTATIEESVDVCTLIGRLNKRDIEIIRKIKSIHLSNEYYDSLDSLLQYFIDGIKKGDIDIQATQAIKNKLPIFDL